VPGAKPAKSAIPSDISGSQNPPLLGSGLPYGNCTQIAFIRTMPYFGTTHGILRRAWRTILQLPPGEAPQILRT